MVELVASVLALIDLNVGSKLTFKSWSTVQSKNTSVEIWVDSISLQPFTQEQWKSHQHQSVEKVKVISFIPA